MACKHEVANAASFLVCDWSNRSETKAVTVEMMTHERAAVVEATAETGAADTYANATRANVDAES